MYCKAFEKYVSKSMRHNAKNATLFEFVNGFRERHWIWGQKMAQMCVSYNFAVSPRVLILSALILSGCTCPTTTQIGAINNAGGIYLPGSGYQDACHVPWLWFENSIDDDTFARLLPAIKAMTPQTLQLSGQTELTDKCIPLINELSSVQVILLEGSGISEDGVRRLRPDIRRETGAGYKL